MRDRHWDALSAELRFELRPDEKFTLRDATEGLRLHEAAPLEKVQKVCSRAILGAQFGAQFGAIILTPATPLSLAAKVCSRAMKEFAIEKALDEMAAGWEPLNFDVVAYRATGTSVASGAGRVGGARPPAVSR